jgi:hypothetical protein
MKRTKRYDEGGDIGIPAQTEEEAANEAAMNSPAARARRNVSDAENQIRADAIAKLENKVAPAMKMDEEAPARMPTRPGQASSGMTKTPMVTKEQLAASGLSLRDYLNKQQGLTRRGESSTPARMPTRPGQEAPTYSNEGKNKPRTRGQGTVMEQGRGADIYGGSINDFRDMFKGTRRGGGDYAKGGSVSSASKRADGIAQRGKTKGKMC